MIKRRFYKLEHGDRNDGASDSSSSSSDSEVEAESKDEESEGEDGVSVEQPKKMEDAEACSTSSGYETEDSSANEVDIDSSGLPMNEEDSETGDERQIRIESQLSDKDLLSADFPACVLKSKSVFKCRICPRIVCLNEETLRAHLKSKRHSRSERLLNGGRLKAILNSDGEIDNEDVPAKQDAEIAPPSQVLDKPKRENRGRQRQRRRLQNKRLKQKKMEHDSAMAKAKPTNESPAKKRRKHEK